MALVFINLTQIISSTGTSASGTVSYSAGDGLLAAAGSFVNNQAGAVGPVITGGGTWTVDTNGEVGDQIDASISSNPAPTGTSATITATDSKAVGGVTCFVYEFSGNPSSSWKDANSPAINTGSGTPAGTGNLSNVTANAVFFACMYNADSSATSTVTGTSANWTYPASGKETNGATAGTVSGTGYDIVSSVTSNNNSQWTIDNVGWICLIAVYKAAAPAAGASCFLWK